MKNANGDPVPYQLSFGCMHLRCCRAYKYGVDQGIDRLNFDNFFDFLWAFCFNFLTGSNDRTHEQTARLLKTCIKVF